MSFGGLDGRVRWATGAARPTILVIRLVQIGLPLLTRGVGFWGRRPFSGLQGCRFCRLWRVSLSGLTRDLAGYWRS